MFRKGTAQAALPSPRNGTKPRRPAGPTALFADLSGYTAVAERLDPEGTKALVDAASVVLSREVTERDGHIDKYIGDNVMAVFGAPSRARGRPRACGAAGLAMQDAMTGHQHRDRSCAA